MNNNDNLIETAGCKGLEGLAFFKDFLPSSPVWVYVASHELSALEVAEAGQLSEIFMQSWKSHGVQVKGSFCIISGRVLVFSADAGLELLSGCSVDSLTAHVRLLGQRFGADLFGRLHVLVWQSEERLEYVSLPDFKTGVALGKYTLESLVFDQSITNRAELISRSRTAAGHTWLKKYWKN